MARTIPPVHVVYTNPKGFRIQKHFKTKASADAWLARVGATDIVFRAGGDA